MKQNDVFDILKPYNNDRISLMSKKELYYFKSCLKNYYLSLRERLELSNKITFGVEIEVDKIRKKIYDLGKNKYYLNKDWIFKNEETLLIGREVNSPVLYDNKNTWELLNEILIDLSDCSEITACCGGHIHFGSQIFADDKEAYYNLFLLWRAYENIIFRFGYGEFISERDNMKKYSIPFLGSYQYDNFNHFFFELHSRMSLSYGKIRESDLKDYKKCRIGKTIEVRSPNGSLNPIIWQNNINFFAKLMMYAKSKSFNRELMEVRILLNESKLKIYNNVFEYFKLIDIESAVELADLIFDNNLDKVYFLRQYIKNEEVGMKVLEKGKKFTNCNFY